LCSIISKVSLSAAIAVASSGKLFPWVYRPHQTTGVLSEKHIPAVVVDYVPARIEIMLRSTVY